MDKRIPVTLLTGFLGSGKTTLLQKLLHHEGMKDTAVIINEIGVAGLDHILARNVEDNYVKDNTVLLGSGCLCCTLRSELASTMRDLFFKRELNAVPHFTRLVIETTGLADPAHILANLLNEDIIIDHYRLDAVIVTVDSQYGMEQIQRHAEARKQAAIADVLLTSKVDLASNAQLEALSSELKNINPGATQHHITHGEIEPKAIIDVGLFNFASKQAQPLRWLRAPTSSPTKYAALAQPVHDDAVRNFTVTLPAPLSFSQLEPALISLCQTYHERLLRMKGILHVSDYPAPLAIHAVQHTLYPFTPLVGWSEENPQSRLVFIGKGLDEMAIRKKLMQI
ncbi:MAG: GTP-binding protein [Sideroxydans sp.]|nr:GTP-binding protein [Sideroxydans sp.]